MSRFHSNDCCRYYMILTLCIRIAESLLTPNEMYSTLAKLNFSTSEECNAIVHKPGKCNDILREKLYPEVRYKFMYCDEVGVQHRWNIPDLNYCSGFDCWESQLTYASKMDMLDIMNRYRAKVADGTCFNWCQYNKKKLIFELRWNYDAEKVAMEYMSKCETEKSERKPFGPSPCGTYDDVSSEYVLTSFQMQTGLQREMRLKLWNLISGNYLKDWSLSSNNFNRGLMIDVGCAFLVRREVNFITALNESVESGNVGYLSCLFMNPMNSTEADEMLETGEENCKKVFDDAEYDQITENYYLTLCRKPINYTYKFDICNNWINPEAENIGGGGCEESSTFSRITWGETPYGLIVRRTKSDPPQFECQCNVPEELPEAPAEKLTNVFHYNCTLNYEVVVQGDPVLCEGWNCDESQLADTTKMIITRGLNDARHLVASGGCVETNPLIRSRCDSARTYCNVARLQWHWFLEWKASEKVQTCPFNYSMRTVEFEDHPFREPVFFEEVTVAFSLPFDDGQLELERIFLKMFWMNFLFDWTTDNYFRRGSALWFGCSIINRGNLSIIQIKEELKLENQPATHLVCIYASVGENFVSEIGPANDETCCQTCFPDISFANPCHSKTVKNIEPYPNLCTSVLYEIGMSCQKKNCDPDHCAAGVTNCISLAWWRGFEGYTNYQEVDGSIRTVHRHVINENLRKTDILQTRKSCEILWGILALQILLMLIVLSCIFKYNIEQEYL